MKISAQFGMWSALVFALFCLYIALDGFINLASITDETRRADGRGFAFFWLFSPYWPGALVIIIIDMLVIHALVRYGEREDVYV